MPTFELTSPRGKKITIDAVDEDTALRGAQEWDLQDHAVSEATRMGVRPDLILRQMHVESRGRPDAVSPKGARGPMQLMPGTAKEMGVDPDDPYANITGGIGYLKKQIDANGGDERLGLAAYNAGPGAVKKYGGVPPYAETQAYVPAVMGEDGAIEGQARLIADRPAATKPRAPVSAKDLPLKPASAAPKRGLAADVGLGLASGTQKAGASLADSLITASPIGMISGTLQTAANLAGFMKGEGVGRAAGPSGGLSAAAAKNGYKAETGAGHAAEVFATMAPNAALPGGPLQRIANVVAPSIGDLTAEGLAKAFGLDENGQRIAGAVGAGLGGLATGIRGTAKLPKANPEALLAEKRRLYEGVEQAGFVFPKSDMTALSGKLTAKIREFAGPKAAQSLPAADGAIAHLRALAGQKGGVTLSQLDLFRSNLYSQLIAKGGAEAKMGYAIRGAIDDLMDSSGAPMIRSAREANTRWEKVSDVTDRLKSAKLAAGRVNSGENLINAQRQKLSPMVDPLHSDEVKNLTPDERGLIEKIVVGDGLSNGLRGVSKTLRNKFVSGPASLLVAGAGGGPWGGLAAMAGLESAGQLLRKMAEGRAKGQMGSLLDLMAAGGKAPAGGLRIAPGYAGLPAVTAPFLATAAMASPRPQPKRKPR